VHQHRRREGVPEEVEEALKLHSSVADAAVVGLPDDRFGEAITAIVEPAPGPRSTPRWLRRQSLLAGFKAPKHVVVVPLCSVRRTAKLRLPPSQGRS
jgi:acyl-CoA synthetase (AMP-forming)/AMP-acid ligase II